MKDLRIVYMGTPEFAVPGLEILVKNGFNIVGVITAPDKPQGRGLKMAMSPVKEYAVKQGLTVLQPEKLKDPAFLENLQALQADLQIVVAFRMLPEAVWNMPPLGTFNLHASLLPQYRGAAPINWAIINGEKETGVTTFFLKHEIDTGDLILQEKEPIAPDDTAGSLYERLMRKGADVILKTVLKIQTGKVETFPQAQNDASLRSAPKIFKEHCLINWQQPAARVKNFVRGMAPYPTAFTHIDGVYAKVFEVNHVEAPESLGMAPQEVRSDGKSYLWVGCADGALSVDVLQLEGKKRMGIKEFLAGHKVQKVG